MPDTATPKIREDLHKRSGGKCECTMECTHHRGRCNAQLRAGTDGWEAHRLNSSGDYVLSNLKALCNTCHKNTPSYGR